jgi:hypothetical protein
MWTVETDRQPLIYRGCAEARQPERVVDGRADSVQAEVTRRGGRVSTEVDLSARMATRAASSWSDGLPRTMLTSGSSFIDRAYDALGAIR